MVEVKHRGAPAPVERSVQLASDKGQLDWQVPEEIPVAVVYNGRNYAVMLATPADLDDFAVGFSLSEQVADHLDDIAEIDIHYADKGDISGAELRISLSSEKLERLDIRQRRRNLVGRAGCGVCGLENAETFFEPLPPVADARMVVAQSALQRALRDLSGWQPLNERTRTVHGAAWARPDGAIAHVREDVGRHNALDKLLGALARQEADLSDGFLLMSSRCSYEIIEKAARLGVRAVAVISGPTAFAIRKAREANIQLYCRSGDQFLAVNQ